MSSMNVLGVGPWSAGLVEVPTTRGRQYASQAGYRGAGLLPTDALGTMQLTIQNVIAGSRYRLELTSDGSLVETGIAAGGDIILTLPYYSPTRAHTLKVRNASGSPSYKPFETQVTIGAANIPVYVLQVADE